MGEKIWIIGIVVLAVLIIGGVYIYNASQNSNQDENEKYKYSEITYDDCVKEKLNELRKLPSASEEKVGAERLDKDGNTWIKQENGDWKSEAKGYEGTRWGDSLIDKQPGGINYIPDEFLECKKYIFTRNAKVEQKISEIVNKIILEQSQKGIELSVKEIQVLNLAGRVQGFIILNCEKMDFEIDKTIVESIADKLFVEYPNDFAEKSERDSWVDVTSCSEIGSSPDGINIYVHQTTWRISDGYFNALI